jgi:predicted RNA binding protein YcfA (HicA-like mRNA interferase family)
VPRLPRISGRQAVAAFERAGFQVRRQSGSHVVLTRPGHPETLSIPDRRELGAGLLRDQIRKSGLTVDQFIKLL